MLHHTSPTLWFATWNRRRGLAVLLICTSNFVSGALSDAPAAMDDRFIYIIKRFVVTATDGTIVALKPSSDRAVGIWRPGSYLQIVADSKVNSIDVSPDGQLVVTGDDHNDAVVWDADTGSRIAVLPHTKPVTSVAFVRNGQAVVTGCRDGATRLWHSNGGPPIWTYPQRPWGEVYYVVVAPSDQLIASGGTAPRSLLDLSGNPVLPQIPGGQLIAFRQTMQRPLRCTHLVSPKPGSA